MKERLAIIKDKVVTLNDSATARIKESKKTLSKSKS